MQKRELFTENKKPQSSESNFLMTIFYNDIYFRRKFITCSIVLSKFNIEGELKIQLKIQYKETSSIHFLQPSVSLGNVISFLKHNFTQSIKVEEIGNFPLKVLDLNESNKNTTQNFVFYDCQSSLFELLNKSLDKETVFIKNKQNLLFALVSSDKKNKDHYEYTEPFILIEKIISNIECIFKREFEKELKNYIQKGPTVWKNYIQFFENRSVKKQEEIYFDIHFFLKMLRDISHIVNLLCLNNQFFITKRDLYILKDSEIFTSKLRELVKDNP